MSKEEAIKALDKGNRIKHVSFPSGEYVYKNNGIITDENKIKYPNFWDNRTVRNWLTGWEIIE